MVRMMRGSLFLSCLLVVSITLSGCSGFEQIFSFIGNLGSTIGNFVQKAVEVGKGVVDKAKTFVQPIIEKGKEIVDKVKPVVEQVKGAIDTGKKVFDDVKEVVSSAKDGFKGLVDTFRGQDTDAAGNQVNANLPVQNAVPDPDNEDANAAAGTTAAAAAGTTGAGAAQPAAAANPLNNLAQALETLADPQKAKEITDKVKQASADIKKKVDSIEALLKDPALTQEVRGIMVQTRNDMKALQDQVKNVLDGKVTTESELKRLQDDLKNGQQAFQDITDRAKAVVNGITSVVDSAKDSFKEFKDILKF